MTADPVLVFIDESISNRYHKNVKYEIVMEAMMIILDVVFKHVYGFDDFHINFAYPRKLSNSLLGDETLVGRDRFRYKKAVILMGTNATGKTSLGKALLKILKKLFQKSKALMKKINF